MCYLLEDADSGEAILIDAPPGAEETIGAQLDARSLTLRQILITHGHWDHFGGAHGVAVRGAAPVAIHDLDKAALETADTMQFQLPVRIERHVPELVLHGGEAVGTERIPLKVIHVPGHTRGHVAYYHAESASLFSGDVLFAGSIGRTDFPGGSYDALMTSIVSLIHSLPATTTVYPGHGPMTTLELERHGNPFVTEYLETLDDGEG